MPEWLKELLEHHGCGHGEREGAREACRRGPTAPIPYLPDLELDTGEPSQIDEIVDVHKKLLQSGVAEQWRQLGALEQNIEEVAVELDGEDPAIPEIQHVLTHGREQLIDLHKEMQRYTGPFDLVEPDEEELGLGAGDHGTRAAIAAVPTAMQFGPF